MAKRELPGLLSISKTSSNRGPDYVSLVIQDARTNRQLVVARVSMEDWAQACFSLGARNADLTVYTEEPRG